MGDTEHHACTHTRIIRHPKSSPVRQEGRERGVPWGWEPTLPAAPVPPSQGGRRRGGPGDTRPRGQAGVEAGPRGPSHSCFWHEGPVPSAGPPWPSFVAPAREGEEPSGENGPPFAAPGLPPGLVAVSPATRLRGCRGYHPNSRLIFPVTLTALRRRRRPPRGPLPVPSPTPPHPLLLGTRAKLVGDSLASSPGLRFPGRSDDRFFCPSLWVAAGSS